MENSSSKRYGSDEVSRIVRRALAMKKDESISHDELLSTARELGLDPQTVEAAVEMEHREYENENDHITRLKHRKAQFHRHLWSYIIVIGGLLLINLLTPGPWWFQWPALGWGIGLAFHFRSAYFPVWEEPHRRGKQATK